MPEESAERQHRVRDAPGRHVDHQLLDPADVLTREVDDLVVNERRGAEGSRNLFMQEAQQAAGHVRARILVIDRDDLYLCPRQADAVADLRVKQRLGDR